MPVRRGKAAALADFIVCLIKSFSFIFHIGTISCFQGLQSRR
ncbi:ABC transporter permease [Peribacillus simplex]